MSETPDPPAAAGGVSVAGRRTPMVLSVARCLREGIERGARGPDGDTPRTVSWGSTTDAQRATVTFSGTDVVVAADAAGEADITWQVRWPDPIPTEDVTGDFTEEVQRLLSGRDVEWRTAADRFWARAGAAPGMPDGLRVVCADDGSESSVGEVQPDGQGLLGTAAALAGFFEGRSTLVEALESGEFGINVSFPVFAALFGANMKVVCGEL